MPEMQHSGVGLTRERAANLAGGTSPEKYGQVTVHLPGREPMVVRRDPERGAMVVNPFRHPDSADAIKHFEKENLIDMKKKGLITSKAVDARKGAPVLEWDKLRISFSEEESRRLSREDLERYGEIVASTLRSDPTGGPGERMVIQWPPHQDTKNAHIDFEVHRFAWDVDAGYASGTIDLGKILERQHEVINAILQEEGLPVLTDVRGPGGQSIYTSQGKQGAYTDDVRADIEAEGGAPAPTGVERTAETRPALDPEEERILRHKEEQVRKAAEISAQIAKLEEERRGTVKLAADADHALEALTKAREARAAADAAKAEADAAKAEAERVKAKAEADVAAALEARQAAEAELSTTHQTLEHESRRANNLEAERNTFRETLETVQAQLTSTTDQLETVTATVAEQTAALEEGARIRADLERERDQLRTDLERERAERPGIVEQAVTAARATWEEEVARPLREQMDEARRQLEQARAELAEVPNKISAAVQDAVQKAEAGWEAKVAGPLRAQLEKVTATANDWMTRAQDTMARFTGLADRLDQMEQRHADALAQQQAAYEARISALESRLSAPAPTAPAQQAPAPAGAPVSLSAAGWEDFKAQAKAINDDRKAKGLLQLPKSAFTVASNGADFDAVPPDQWNPAQRAFAERTLTFYANHKDVKIRRHEGDSLETFGAKLHEAWKKRGNDGGDGSGGGASGGPGGTGPRQDPPPTPALKPK